MFVLVVDTSLMNVSISSVVKDLDTDVSSVQAAIALEALVSAAFILINSKVGDLIGRKRAYVLGLLAYAIGALAMTLAQSVTAIIIFWAIIGGLGASLLLPAMQSLIHGNFKGAARTRTYALVGAAAAIAAAVGPLLGGFVTTYLSWRVGFGLEAVVIAVVLSQIKLVHDVAYTGPRQIDLVGAILSVLGMGGLVLGILVWQEGGEFVGLLIAIGAVALALLAYWLVRRKREGNPTLIDPGLFKFPHFTSGIFGQLLQNVTLGGAMIALPIFLQMTLEYNAMKTGLTLAPLSLSMFAVAMAAGIMLAFLAFSFTNQAEDSAVIPQAQQQQIADTLEDDAQVMSNSQLEPLLAGEPEDVQAEVLRINKKARDRSLQIALIVPVLASLLGLLNGFRMRRLPDPVPATIEGVLG